MRRYNEKTFEIFVALLRAGLWEKEVRLAQYGRVDYDTILQVANEQSVVGLVAAGLEKVVDLKLPQTVALQFAGQALQIERRNKAMNVFVADLFEKLNEAGVNAVLVKGQGVAQCYEKPLWRSSGDVDLLLDSENYEKAKEVLFPIADKVEGEKPTAKHQALNMKGFEVELHGRMPFFLSKRVDEVIDDVLDDTTKDNGGRVWNMYGTEVCLPKVDNDVIIVFTHFLFHFFVEGVGLRQICDWCRLIWTYKDSINKPMLNRRLEEAGLMTEWRVFAAIAVEYLCMPKETMPFYEKGYSGRARRALNCVMKNGNMGHNNDLSYKLHYSRVVAKFITFFRRFKDFARFSTIFPIDAPKFFLTYLLEKL